jgi:hypothetical protein
MHAPVNIFFHFEVSNTSSMPVAHNVHSVSTCYELTSHWYAAGAAVACLFGKSATAVHGATSISPRRSSLTSGHANFRQHVPLYAGKPVVRGSCSTRGRPNCARRLLMYMRGRVNCAFDGRKGSPAASSRNARNVLLVSRLRLHTCHSGL